MPSTHRGAPVGDNHRPLPRLTRAIASQINQDTSHDPNTAEAMAKHVIASKRQGSPVEAFGNIKSGPVFTNVEPYVTGSKYDAALKGIRQNDYGDGGQSDWLSAETSIINGMHDTNKIVRSEGGVSKYIGKAVKNRKSANYDPNAVVEI